MPVDLLHISFAFVPKVGPIHSTRVVCNHLNITVPEPPSLVGLLLSSLLFVAGISRLVSVPGTVRHVLRLVSVNSGKCPT
jgi:hypothetical protein